MFSCLLTSVFVPHGEVRYTLDSDFLSESPSVDGRSLHQCPGSGLDFRPID